MLAFMEKRAELNISVASPDITAQLSRKQRMVYDFMENHQVASSGITIEQICEQLSVSPSTIIRTAKALGYEGFGDLKREMRYAYLQTLQPTELLKGHRENAQDTNLIVAQLRKDLENLKELMEMINPKQVSDLAQRIVSAERTLIVSTGSYAALGHILSHQCRFIGYNVDIEARGGSYLAHELARLTEHDLVLGIAFWRGPRSVSVSLEWAQSRGIPTAAITDSKSSRIAQHSNLVIAVPCESTAFYQSMVAGLSLVYATINAVWQYNQGRADVVAREAQQLYLDLEPGNTSF